MSRYRRARTTIVALLLLSGSAEAARAQRGQPAPPAESEAEARLRLELLQRSLGFGGLFGPALGNWVRTPPREDPCGGYTDYAACQAHKAGDDWAAQRLQEDRSTGAERDWYNR